MTKIIRNLSLIFTLMIILTASFSGFFVYNSLKGVPAISFKSMKNRPHSVIYDESGNIVEVLGETKEEYISYNEIPPILINALLSIEDINFFSHRGVDISRTFKAFLNNIISSTTQGGSTITQQLVKNTILNGEQTYKRKIQEAFLSLQIEKELTKEEILTLYFNYVYFEQSIPGVRYASKRYFNKDVTLITLPEAALLAGIVKSASFYNPFKYPDRINERKNLVLDKMYEYGFISQNEKVIAKNTHVQQLIVNPNDNYQEPTYRFQSYLDVVYLEIEKICGLNPYNVPLEIHTYLDSSLQNHLDQIQDGEVIEFTDNNQQIGGSVIRNSDCALIGVIGGKDYKGARIFNRAYSLKRQPASTIKPLFGYLLAAEYLHYNEATSVLDAPYTYPNSDITVQNADHTYNGFIPMVDALGYSKNTSALFTLEKVINKIGLKKTEQHLKDIGLMDEGPFSYSYGIGGMTYGISPTALANAYALLNRNGEYLPTSTIAYIKNIETGEIIYQRSLKGKQVVSKESAFQIANTLINVVKNDYYHIGVVRVDGVQIGAKTGTNGYDKKAASALNYPLYADKDSWIAGFSKDYTMAVWSGFDNAEKGDTNYFTKNDKRRLIPKKIFQNVMQFIADKNSKISSPSSLIPINVVKGTENYYLPNKYIPSYYQVTGYFYPNEIPNNILPDPILPYIYNAKVYLFDDEIQVEWESQITDSQVFDYRKIWGDYIYQVTYENNDEKNIIYTNSNKIIIPYNSPIKYLEITPCYTQKKDVTGTPYYLFL